MTHKDIFIKKITLIMLFIVCFLGLVLHPVYLAEEYVYYGVVPSRIQYVKPRGSKPGEGQLDPSLGWEIEAGSIANSALVTVVALEDDTNVKVLTLKDGVIVFTAKLNAVQKLFVTLPNGTLFKVVSDHLVSVMLLGGNIAGKEIDPSGSEGPSLATFFMATDGSFVGKEFIFVASQGLTGSLYNAIALEDSDITVISEDGEKESFKLQANSYKSLAFTAFKAYRVESTGHVMIQSGGPGTRSFSIPSAEGGFVGKRFYSNGLVDWSVAFRQDNGFRILPVEDTKVTIWNLVTKSKALEVEVKGGVGINVKPKGEVIMVESDKPTTFTFVHNGTVYTDFTYGAGVDYVGVKPNEETMIFLSNSSVEAYVFAYEDSLVKINDAPIPIKADSFFTLNLPGIYRILSDKNAVVQIIHWPFTPSIQGIQNFGVVVPCIQTVDVKPDVDLTPLVGEGLSIIYIIIGAVATIAVVTAGFLAMKRRPKK